MSELSIQELEKTATAYDELLVPALFQPWANRVTEAANLHEGQRVLDVACGTGALARAAAKIVGTTGTVIGLDINPGMLLVAQKAAPEIAWVQGSASSLPFEDASFDAVISQFGLMLFPDRYAALREMLRVLQEGGQLVVAVFDSLTANHAYGAIADAYQRVASKEVADALRYPFSMGDTEELSVLATTVGLPSAMITTQEGVARFPSVRDTVLADVKGWFPLAGINLDEHTIDAVISDVETALEPQTDPSGRVEFPVSVHLITATKT